MNAPEGSIDHTAMRRALELAALGLETTDPNPRVGCVIVRDGKTVGEGWHRRAGEAHAEVNALAAAGTAARGATAYVTLEPCSHRGRTPPCANALVEAQVSRVVFASDDPNPQVNGRGAAILRAAGIKVESGLCSDAAESLNIGFFKRMRTGLPFVRVKIAMSLDGRTALANGQSQWITGTAARSDVQRWRARSSAVVTGIGTVLADDPRLTVREPESAERQPARVILDSHWRTPAGARVLHEPGLVMIYGSNEELRGGHLIERGDLRLFETDPHDLAAVVRSLGSMELNEILVEAGSRVAGAFLNDGLADELIVYIAPVMLGPQARAMASFPVVEELTGALRFRIAESFLMAPDLRLILRPAPHEES